LPSTTAANATAPEALTAGGPNPAKVPPAGAARHHRLGGLAPAPHGGEEDHVAARVDRGRVDAGEHRRRHARHRHAGGRDRAEPAGRPGEDALDRASARHRGREGDGARVVERRGRMLAKAGELADPGDPVASPGHRDDAAGALEEDALVGDASAERSEEGDVAARIDRCDDRQSLLAEAVEAAAARDRIAGAREGAERVCLAGMRRASG
jgi:hypothetical protein